MTHFCSFDPTLPYTIDCKATGKNIHHLMSAHRTYSMETWASVFQLSSPQSIYKWWHGKTLPTVNHLYTLSKILSVPMDGIIVAKNNGKEPEFGKTSGNKEASIA